MIMGHSIFIFFTSFASDVQIISVLNVKSLPLGIYRLPFWLHPQLSLNCVEN